MSLIYITGIETAGKTTVCKALKNQGCEAYGIDEGIAHYYNKKTGQRSEWLSSAAARTTAWYHENTYMMDREHVAQLKMQAKDKPIFLCGTTQSDKVVLDLFDKTVYLFLDEETLKHRMDMRDAGEFGYASNEKQAILSWHKSSENTYQKYGAAMVDATQPVDEVLNQILKVANQ